MESRTGNSIRNIAFSLGNQLISVLLGFASRMVFLRIFGVEYLGINGLFADVLTLLSMADLGFGTAMAYSFYRPVAEKDYKKIAALTTFFKKVYKLIAIVVAVIGISLVPILPQIVNLENNIPNLGLYYLLALADVVSSYLFVYKSAVLSANQENYVVSKVNIVVNTCKIVAQVIGAYLFRNYVVYLIVGLVFTIGNNITISAMATRRHPYIKETQQLASEEKKGILRNIFSVLIYKVSSVLLNATDNLLISVITGTAMVGYYSNYLLIQNRITQFYTLAFGAITASIGNLIVKENEEKRFEIFENAQCVSFVICGVLIPCYTVLVRDFIGIWLGEEYSLPMTVSLAIGLNMYLSCVCQPLWSYREATGLYRKTKWVMACCAALNLGLSYILGKLIGITGIILASALSRLLTYIWYEPRLLFRKYFKKRENGYYLQLIQNFAYVAAITLASISITSFFKVDSIGVWLLEACIVGCICCAVTAFMYRKTVGLQKVLNMIKEYIKSVRGK